MSILNHNLPGYKYQGDFEIDGIVYPGVMYHDSEHGHIGLNLLKHFSGEEARNYSPRNCGRISVIHAKIDHKKNITLYKCRCTENTYIEIAEDQKSHLLKFSVQYFVMWGSDDPCTEFDSFRFTVENGMDWSKISRIKVRDNPTGGPPNQVIFRGNEYFKKYIMGGSLIQFRSEIDNEALLYQNNREHYAIVERLQITITPQSPSPITYFLGLRDQIVDMISFAIKDNVNILSQKLICGSEEDGNREEYFVRTNKRPFPILHTKSEEFHFLLDQLPKTKDVSRSLNRLEPIFRLYASFYRYKDMPLEMLFLNVTQALETMHSRFYYTPRDQSSNSENGVSAYIPKRTTLLERITELLDKGENQIFAPLCNQELRFAERVVLSRNYYTHYQESMWQSALDSDCLYDVVRILKCVLEYYICVQLEIDISDRVKAEIEKICIGIDGQPIDIFQA